MPLPNQPSRTRAAAPWVAVAVALVGGFEGVRTIAYKDPVGIPTICFGETKGVKMGDKATMEQCNGLLADSLAEANRVFETCVGPLAAGVPDRSRIAYVSFIYNVGPGRKGYKDGFCTLKSGNPSSMLRMIKIGNFIGSCKEFPKWATAIGGIPLPGLTIRRKEEMAFCLQGADDWSVFYKASLPS